MEVLQGARGLQFLDKQNEGQNSEERDFSKEKLRYMH